MISRFNRTIALFLAVIFAVSCVALATDTQATITAENMSADQGDSISIPVSIENNAGFCSFTADVSYDADVLSPTDNPVTTELSGALEATSGDGVITITYTNDADVSGDSALFTLNFDVSKEAEVGSSAVSVSATMQNLAGDVAEVSANAEISVEAVPYTVTVNSDDNGTASATQESYYYGDVVTVTATPKANCSFVGWTSEDGVEFASASSAETTFTMPAKNVTVKANFLNNAETEHKLTVTQAQGGTVSGNEATYAIGEVVHLDAIPDEGYYFSKWQSADIAIADKTPTIEFKMPGRDITVTPVFEKLSGDYHAINLMAAAGGTVELDYFRNFAEYGTEIKAVAVPESGYTFKEWKGNTSSIYLKDTTNPVLNFAMPAEDVVLTAVFEYNPNKKYKVTIHSEGGGTAGSTYKEYLPGDRVLINATQQLGFVFYSWSTTDEDIEFANPENPSTSFIMPARDVVIIANFTYNSAIIGGLGGGTTGSANNNNNNNNNNNVCMITFNSMGGSYVAPISAFIGGKLSTPTAPTRAGYTFSGWYTDAACTNAYSFESTVSQSFTLYARWTEVAQSESKERFTDVKSNDWFYTPVYDLVNRGIINGITQTTFAPNQSVTRAQFAQMLALASGATLSGNTCSFADVSKNDWFYPAVAWASKAGIVNGVSADRFDPSAKISRQDMAVMITRYIDNVSKSSYNESASVTFADDAQISAYAKDAVSRAQRYSIIGGKGNNLFAPRSNATRAEAAKMIYAMLTLSK